MIIYSRDAEADRAFFRDVLRFPHVDVGDGWLIFRLPPAELGIHPAEQNGKHEIYLTCDDVPATVQAIQARGLEGSAPVARPWGLSTTITLPGGGKLDLYQPSHPLPPAA